MITIISKSGSFSSYVKATSQVVASQVKPLVNPVVTPAAKEILPSVPVAESSYSLSKLLPSSDLKVSSNLTGKVTMSSIFILK